MKTIATIGQQDASIQYQDRPTVKVVIKKDDEILIINKGLLPGGGVEPGETNDEAIARELQEELGVTVQDIQEIGTVVQYRSLINKKYLVHGYSAVLNTTGGPTSPQDEAEAQLSVRWFTPKKALAYVEESIQALQHRPMDDATAQQSLLYNLMTTRYILS